MKIKKYGSATILIETSDISVLCDPWLTDGVYYGSWFNYPPINLAECDFSKVNYVYISHIHPDHFDPQTMKLLDKSIPVLIHKYHKKFLKFNIEKIGFKVIELENGIPMQLSDSTKFSIYAADNCDPSICGRMFGCTANDLDGSMQIDSLCIIDDGKHVLVNTNDCAYGIAETALKKVKSLYKSIDFALVGYTSASLFPHCMMNYSKEQMKAGVQKAKNVGLLSGLNTLKLLKPKNYLPFAGNYILGGPYHSKNKNISIPEIQDAVLFFQKELRKHKLYLNPVMLNFAEFFDTETNIQSSAYTPINIKAKSEYINNVVSKFHYEFEKDQMPSQDEIIQLFSKSLKRLNKKQNEINFFEEMNLLFDISNKLFVCINLKDTSLSVINDISKIKNYHRFQLDPRLLKRALNGPRYANWNNIEIGALLNFERRPDNYRVDIHLLVNALHV